ncbi:hypothetical protein B0I37DRAFT_386937 [Chaetomium sp. MPI-CAGE-AT-0009]|nr:hypothetical protein B0I37DRAFT_386937 [Chaetomium sp. MPI-CAGE-AT-0009]
MLSSPRSFRLACGGCISLAVFRKSTALLASPTFGRWNNNRMAIRHHMQHNSNTIRTVHTAGMPRNGDNPFTPAEREKIRKLLQQGYTPWETFSLIGTAELRNPQSVFVAMIKEDKELASLVRERKRGKWSDEEKEHLIKLTWNRRRIDVESIARQIGREPEAVRCRLRLMAKEKSVELGNDAVSFSVAFLDRDLGEEEESILKARMSHVIDGLPEDADTTTQWRATLSAKSIEAWAATIIPLIPTRVKHILAAPNPPTAADWRSLAWQDTSLFGVYAWILKRGGGAGLNPLRVGNYVYIGSATKYAHGLSGRALQHREGDGGFGLNHRIKQRGLSRTTGHFATLLAMEAASSDIGDITKAQELVVFAEAIFTIWFGALTETESAGVIGRAGKHRRLHSLSPWEHPQQFNYEGLCSHNPLALDLKSGKESAHPPKDTNPV